MVSDGAWRVEKIEAVEKHVLSSDNDKLRGEILSMPGYHMQSPPTHLIVRQSKVQQNSNASLIPAFAVNARRICPLAQQESHSAQNPFPLSPQCRHRGLSSSSIPGCSSSSPFDSSPRSHPSPPAM
jgi:hypothetical protein